MTGGRFETLAGPLHPAGFPLVARAQLLKSHTQLEPPASDSTPLLHCHTVTLRPSLTEPSVRIGFICCNWRCSLIGPPLTSQITFVADRARDQRHTARLPENSVLVTTDLHSSLRRSPTRPPRRSASYSPSIRTEFQGRRLSVQRPKFVSEQDNHSR